MVLGCSTSPKPAYLNKKTIHKLCPIPINFYSSIILTEKKTFSPALYVCLTLSQTSPGFYVSVIQVF